MHSQYRPASVFTETFSTLFSPLTVFVWLACIAVASLAGPFGTYAGMDWPQRTLYWTSIVTTAILFGYAVRGVAVLVIGFDRPILFDLFAATTMALIYGPVVWTLRVSFQADALGNEAQILRVMINTFVMAAGVFVLRRQLCDTEPGGYLVPESETPYRDHQPRLLRRLSEDKQGMVIRLSANGHYVQIVTDQGSEIVRLRLTDAIDEMEPVEGFCTHRSHWVTSQAITGVERENAQKFVAVLANGDRVPISRKYRANLEKAGIIETTSRSLDPISGKEID